MHRLAVAGTAVILLALGILYVSRAETLATLREDIKRFVAAIFFVDSSTEETLRQAYDAAGRGGEKLKILIVPGHDTASPGAEFRGLREADLTALLGETLAELLREDPRLSVTLARSREGTNPMIAAYLAENRERILSFVASQKALMREFVALGKIESRITVEHNAAPERVAFTLYGINTWANETGQDIVIHIHFNDVPRKNRALAGAYSGFSIYVPERQYSNAKGSGALARAVFERLARFYPSSNLPKEDIGIVEDQELIAVGANNTLDGASLLIEYGYIYEPLIQNPALREVALDDLAFQTHLGIKDFFDARPSAARGRAETRYLPRQWARDISRGAHYSRDTLALQAALSLENLYPPQGKTKNDCPLSGVFGPCTEEAVRRFQQTHSIEPTTGAVGPKTRAKLNELFSSPGAF